MFREATGVVHPQEPTRAQGEVTFDGRRPFPWSKVSSRSFATFDRIRPCPRCPATLQAPEPSLIADQMEGRQQIRLGRKRKGSEARVAVACAMTPWASMATGATGANMAIRVGRIASPVAGNAHRVDDLRRPGGHHGRPLWRGPCPLAVMAEPRP